MAQHRVVAPWFFIALILSNHGIAMAARIEVANDLREELGVEGLEALAQGPGRDMQSVQSMYHTMTCPELAAAMTEVTVDAANRVSDDFDEARLLFDIDASQIREIATLTIRIGAIADVADQKLCLPEVLRVGRVNDIFQQFHSAQETFINAALSEESQNRFRHAFRRVAAVQSDLIGLLGRVFDRHVLLPTNVEDPAVCPSPCLSCTREHNSWFQEAEEFSFKCILDADSPKPEGDGFMCAELVRRRSSANERKTWCEVQHWQQAAAQTLGISAVAACGARSILAPLQHGSDMSESAIAACEKEVVGEAMQQEEVDELRRLDTEIDDVVSPGNLAIFSLFVITELIGTVSELRSATRAPSSSLLEVAQPGQLPMAYTQDISWGCRRGVLELASSLFGGMIEVVMGIAYLAIMGSLGLLAAMAAFGADAVVATLAPLAGLSYAGLGEAVGDGAHRLARFLLNMQDTLPSILREVGASGVAAGHAEVAGAAAVAAGHAELEAQVLSHTVRALEGFGGGLAAYWPVVAGGLTILGAGFGIWGLARLRRAFDGTFRPDCAPGYAFVDGEPACHPAMRFGEAHAAHCPGKEDSSNTSAPDLVFLCSRRNGGIATFSADSCPLDRAHPLNTSIRLVSDQYGWSPGEDVHGGWGWCRTNAPGPGWTLNGTEDCSKGPPVDIKVLTYNLFWWNLFGLHGGRNQSAGKLIESTGPYDILGFQECDDVNRILAESAHSEGYGRYHGSHAVANAWLSTEWELIAHGSEDVAEDHHSQWFGRRGLVWVRLQHFRTRATVFFANHHGPLPVGTPGGGLCGPEATAYNILRVIGTNAHKGDAVILTGDFNAHRNSRTEQALRRHLTHQFQGTSFGGVDNFYSNDCVAKVDAENLGGGGSDHDALSVTFTVQR